MTTSFFVISRILIDQLTRKKQRKRIVMYTIHLSRMKMMKKNSVADEMSANARRFIEFSQKTFNKLKKIPKKLTNCRYFMNSIKT